MANIMLDGARFISIRPPMEIQPIHGVPPAMGFIGGGPLPPPREEPEPDPEDLIVGLAPCYEKKIFSIRDNSPSMNHLFIGYGLDPRAWKQLGQWMPNNTHLLYLCIQSCHLKGKPMADLCKGLQHNKSIREFEIGDNPLKKEEMESLAPFISNNPSLHTLNIEGALKSCSVELLSSALASRARSIENLSLDGNCLGGPRREGGDSGEEYFDTFINALNKNSELKRLSLMGNQIGETACTSLAKLLSNPDSKLKSLVLRHNYIDDKCAAILAESLSRNTQLNNIDLDRNERMTTKGLHKLLNVVCKAPSSTIRLTVKWECPTSEEEMSAVFKIKLNEPLHSLGAQLYANRKWKFTEEDLPCVKLTSDYGQRWKLEWNETPFFYNMKEGDTIYVLIQADGKYAIPNILDISKGRSGDEISKGGLYETYTSNHTLASLGYETALKRNYAHGHLLRECLEANKKPDKNSAARIKIFHVHIEYNLSLSEFAEMDLGVQPLLLAWIGRALDVNDKDSTYLTIPPTPAKRLDMNYRIMRALPMLCGFK